MSRRGRQVQVSAQRSHADGELAGEPVELQATEVHLGPVQSSEGMPLTRAARHKVMRGSSVPFAAEPQEGEIPIDGTPRGGSIVSGGSVLPVVAASRQIEATDDEWSDLVSEGQVIAPPYDPWLLVCAYEESDCLPPLVDAMATNLTGFGLDLAPLFPTRDPDTGQPVDAPPEAAAEREALELFLASANVEHGLIGVLGMVDRDTEIIGCGYVEVLRDSTGRVAAVEHLPAWTVRLGHLARPVLVDLPFRHPTTGELVTLRRWRRFRTFVQSVDSRVTYFKQFGDPRTINRANGLFKPAGESWGQDAHGNSLDGTEVVYRRVYATWTPYGVPRWTGAMPHVRAGRSAGELVVSWFNDAPIGAKVAMVAGGTWTRDSYNAAVGKIDNMARGQENAWSLVVLEAETATTDLMEDTSNAAPRMALEDLAYELPASLYAGEGNLLDSSHRRVARMFRLPPIYWGGSDDYSRAAANTARATAEEQVFVPERKTRWLQWFNSELLPSMGVNYWQISLRGANTTDDAETPIGEIAQGGGASPNALIKLWNELTGQDEAPIAEPWGDRPLALTSLLVQAGVDPNLPLADVLGAPEGGSVPELEGEGTPGARANPELGDTPAQDTALNGAQVTAALAIVQEAVAGGISIPMANAMLVEFFNLAPDAADRILADADAIEPEPEPVPPSFPGSAPGGNNAVTDGEQEQVRRRAAPRLTRKLDRLADELERELRDTNPTWFA